jgi:hypothetical protein
MSHNTHLLNFSSHSLSFFNHIFLIIVFHTNFLKLKVVIIEGMCKWVIQNMITLPDKSEKAMILLTPHKLYCAVKENELISQTHREKKAEKKEEAVKQESFFYPCEVPFRLLLWCHIYFLTIF